MPGTCEVKAVTKDGKLLATEIDFVIDGGAYCTLSPVVLSRGTIHAAGPYFCPNVRITSKAIATNHPDHSGRLGPRAGFPRLRGRRQDDAGEDREEGVEDDEDGGRSQPKKRAGQYPGRGSRKGADEGKPRRAREREDEYDSDGGFVEPDPESGEDLEEERFGLDHTTLQVEHAEPRLLTIERR